MQAPTIKKSFLKEINFKLLTSLLFLGLVQTLYSTFRVYLVGQLPSDYAYSIAGQLSWVNLIYEVINESILLPLFFFFGAQCKNKNEVTNRIKTGLIAVLLIYSITSIIICIFSKEMLFHMAVSPELIGQSAEYIKIESVAKIPSIMLDFLLIAMISVGKSKLLYVFTIAKLVISAILDAFLVSSLPVSLNLGINGIGYSNFLSSIFLLTVILHLIRKSGYSIFTKDKLCFEWMAKSGKTCCISGVESFVRNAAYMLMISRMVNMVAEQGTYWVANSFIWGWLLLPITQLSEVIKRDVSHDPKNGANRIKSYAIVTCLICGIWILTIPTWEPFIAFTSGEEIAEKTFKIILILLPFYICYAFQNIFDSVFYGTGKTEYMLAESVLTNSIFYGTAYILLKMGVWHPTLNGIALMFGLGMLFDSIVSALAYMQFRKRNFPALKNITPVT